MSSLTIMSKVIRGGGSRQPMQEAQLSTKQECDDRILELVEEKPENALAKRIAAAAELAALSVAVSPVATFLPRLNWGIAIFDPVSFFWIAAFLIGGPYVGITASIAGTFTLFFTDPTLVGPAFKLAATLPLIIVPAVYVKLWARDRGGETLSNARLYAILMLIAFVVRLVVMVPINIVLVPILMGVNDVTFIVQYTVLLNTLQSFWDALVPFVIVHRTPVFKHFRLW